MKIAIPGTRGIPNHYGGFEAFAENLSVNLVMRGHDVIVFNSSLHPYKQDNYKGVQIVHCLDPENTLGTAGQFIYDLNCILECRKIKPDIILQLGYTSSSVWSSLLPQNSLIITNMDGLEWMRAKYSGLVKSFLKHAEKWAVKSSHFLVADNPAIKDYLFSKYHVRVEFIPYGVDVPATPDEKALGEFQLSPDGFNLIIARIEPENNIETIIRAHLATQSPPLIIVGGINNGYAKQLLKKYASRQIIFKGGIYDANKLNVLRHYCLLYFHGHSVGGTNPSLLEAMASSAPICAHENEFNRSVLHTDALYFGNEDDITNHLNANRDKGNFTQAIKRNLEKIKTMYTPGKISDSYESLFLKCLDKK